MAMTTMLRRDRAARRFSEGQVAWRLGITVAAYRKLEAAGVPASFEVYDRICKLFGWPQSFR